MWFIKHMLQYRPTLFRSVEWITLGTGSSGCLVPRSARHLVLYCCCITVAWRAAVSATFRTATRLTDDSSWSRTSSLLHTFRQHAKPWPDVTSAIFSGASNACKVARLYIIQMNACRTCVGVMDDIVIISAKWTEQMAEIMFSFDVCLCFCVSVPSGPVNQTRLGAKW